MQDSKETIRKLINAPAERVFGAWADPVAISQWMHPAGRQVIRVDMDFQAGGHLRVDIADASGALVHTGHFLAIVPNEQITFTWHSIYTGDKPAHIDVIFEKAGDDTFLTLHNDLIPAQDAIHAIRWHDILDSFAIFAVKQEQSPDAIDTEGEPNA